MKATSRIICKEISKQKFEETVRDVFGGVGSSTENCHHQHHHT